MSPSIGALVQKLSLAEKVELLTGQDMWQTAGNARIGLRPMRLSDGPSGVRGEFWDERHPSLNLPSATSLSSSWNRELARDYGRLAAAEARSKNVHAVLGPTVNLHRSPLGGRHFEAYSEDPVLSAEIAAAVVEGTQSSGVAACLKHYVANDYETQRYTADTVVDEKALYELYLLAFEKAIVSARCWMVMSAYNHVNGTLATESELLEAPLKTDWGFDGVVVSDWTAVRTIASARAAQDLVMPGPDGPWGEALVKAVEAGEVPEDTIDDKVHRMLLLASRVGALEGYAHDHETPEIDGRAFIRRAAAEGSVLLANDGILPLRGPRTVAVLGHNATAGRSQGGGSATVVPEHVVSALEGLKSALPGTGITYSLGAVAETGISEFPLSQTRNPVTGEPGMRAEFIGFDGSVVKGDDRRSTDVKWLGGAPTDESEFLRLSLDLTPDSSGTVHLGVGTTGHFSLRVDGAVVLEDTLVDNDEELGAGLLAPPTSATPVTLTAGVTVRIDVEYTLPKQGAFTNAVAIAVGTRPTTDADEQLIEDAVVAARAAEVAVVVVGTNAKVESEGFDRESLRLPGRQDDLVAAVTAANPRTVVVVNSGSPVEMPWRDAAAAVLLVYFPGQEFGHALADVLLGHAEPGGRLPTTWPVAEADVPVLDVTPVDGKLAYAEGIHIGYKAWLRSGVKPAYGFGHGLGYTTFEVSDVAVSDGGKVTARVLNSGAREGKVVVQVYASKPDSAVERPAVWLVGFATARLGAGDSGELTVDVPTHLLRHREPGEWALESGEYQLHVGLSLDDALTRTATLTV
ncbi:beta-glucosidase [Kineosporia succinea]|uniref:Beta-glucosidase n=1 Tax=Kineosporia succinea TaxID=84632 RepID=A0ABT9NVJ5_9ACTN|nr:glycoside hydrolase family 3 C-terminal domain-containing protein [Kineosporia succinea]MDP9824439.1 beta-glucosidase [Kineosporia succinea]